MKITQMRWAREQGWKSMPATVADADIVFIFGETAALKDQTLLADIRKTFPDAPFFGCSTAGEIQSSQVYDDGICATAVKFDSTKVQMKNLSCTQFPESLEAGKHLANLLDPKDLIHVLVLSVGLNVNGSELVKGLLSGLPKNVTISGGLAGDNDRFKETLVISQDKISSDIIAAVGLYGPNIKVRSASVGGWDSFGPVRVVTKSTANVLFELDGKSALELYKTYLGDHAKELPASALLFPLALHTENSQEGLVRTILGIDEAEQSMTFAGDIPLGSKVQLMKVNFDRLIDGAIGAAEAVQSKVADSRPELALLISCVGRKLVLKQRTEEELEGVRDVFGEQTALMGFYSYGEISPFNPEGKCELHNQTMTITTLTESET